MVKIADINIDFECHSKDFFYPRLTPYQTTAAPEMKLVVKAVDEITIPKGNVITAFEHSTLMQFSKKEFCLYYKSDLDRIFLAAFFDNSYSEVEVRILETFKNNLFSFTDLEYMWTGEFFSNRMLACGGGTVHGSGLCYQGHGVVFSGVSGVGKSTHTELWRKVFGKDVVVVNDDKPAIRFYGETPMMFGTPWSGTSDVHANVSCPLKAIVFLKQAKENSIRRLSALETVYGLMNQTFPPFYDEGLSLKNVDFVDRMVARVPAFELSCNMSHDAVRLAHENIFGRMSK